MTNETYDWLENNVMVGFSKTRPVWWNTSGNAKHMFEGPVPMESIKQLLTSWSPNKSPIYNADMREIDGWAEISRSDTGETLGVMGSEYQMHTYQGMLEGIEQYVPDAQISSTGMLKRGSQAWVQIERDSISHASGGVEFLPYVSLSTSLDGSISSQINQGAINVVCDNTMHGARGSGLVSSVRHTKDSLERLLAHYSVLSALAEGETNFKEYVDNLLATKVDDLQFQRFVDSYVPIDESWGEARKTMAKRKRQDITQLYKVDERASSWKGTGWGALQAVNTYDNHLSRLLNKTGKDMDDTNLRAMRNYSYQAKGQKVSDDAATEKVLMSVL